MIVYYEKLDAFGIKNGDNHLTIRMQPLRAMEKHKALVYINSRMDKRLWITLGLKVEAIAAIGEKL